MKDPRYSDRVFQLVRFLKLVSFLNTVFIQVLKYNGDTNAVNNFVDLLYDYDFIDYDELMILKAFHNTLVKEKKQCLNSTSNTNQNSLEQSTPNTLTALHLQ